MKKIDKKENVVTIGPKYQVVIPKALRNKHRQFAKGARVHLYPLDNKTIALHVEDDNWAKNQYGALKDIWEGINVEKELKKLRNEWD